MCGVVGFYCPEKNILQDHFAIFDLIKESMVRGTHACGFTSLYEDGKVFTRKEHKVEKLMVHMNSAEKPKAMIFHNRYSTSGDYTDHNNNQPINANGASLVFNGVIDMRTKEEMEAQYGPMKTGNDGEIFLKQIHQIVDWTREKEDSMSFAGMWISNGEMFVYRNLYRPLYKAMHNGALFFASTRDIFIRAGFEEQVISPVEPKRVFRASELYGA